jgi:hypothetical protein
MDRTNTANSAFFIPIASLENLLLLPLPRIAAAADIAQR